MFAARRLALALASVMSFPLIGLACQHTDEGSANAPEANSVDGPIELALADDDPTDVKENGVQLGIADLGGGGILEIDSATIGSQRVVDVHIEKSTFAGTIRTLGGDVEVVGQDFLGAHLHMNRISEAADGSAIVERVDATIAHVLDLGDGVYAHDLQIFDPTNNNYVPACPTTGFGIVLQGSWDADSGDALGGAANELTFACMDGALSKCTEWGYTGWSSPEMAQMHQACTRAVRADFCGEGRANTVDGTRIDIYDRGGIEAQATSWPVEAEWGPDGATCRGPSMRMRGDDPYCLEDIPVTAGCGKLPGTKKSGVIATRYQAL